MSILEIKFCEQLSECVEKLTTSGKSDLDTQILKDFKGICRKSDEYISHAYRLLMHQMEKDHAQIRLSTLLICDELFQRSHRFRELMMKDFQYFMELTVGCNAENELPKPKPFAIKLQRKALECISQWFNKFGEGYKILCLGYHFLKDCKNINFSDINTRTEAERTQESEAIRRQQIINNEKLRILQLEINESLPEIKCCIDQMQTCVKLLKPADSVFDKVDFEDPQPCCSKYLPEAESKLKEIDKLVREHGLVSSRYSLTIKVAPEDKSPVKVTTDNKDIVRSLQDLNLQAITSFLPTVEKWIQVAIKCSTTSEELKTAIDTKNALSEMINKCKEIGITAERISDEMCSSTEDEEDFEEVKPKDGYEPVIPVHQRKLYGLSALPTEGSSTDKCKQTVKDWKVFNEEESELYDPTSFKCNAKRMEIVAREKGLLSKCSDSEMIKPSTAVVDIDPAKRDLLARAPKIRLVEMGGVQLDAAAVTLKQEMGHRFWTSGQDKQAVKSPLQDTPRLGRIVEVDSQLNSVKWSCRTPLPSGKLCPRRDRHKCPLHGVIIARDKMGQPSIEEDKKKLEELKEKEQRENPEWQDPTLLKELQAATGIDLTIKKRTKGTKTKSSKKLKQYPNLEEIKSSKSTARSRLQKKVFNAASVKKVARVLDSQDRKKYNDKFGNQFNYAWKDQ